MALATHYNWGMHRAVLLVSLAMTVFAGELEKARDAQDRAALDRLAAQSLAEAQSKPNDPMAQYKAAMANSYLAEIAIELKDKSQAHTAAEAGIKAAERALSLKSDSAEYHRIYGTLCGQAISANILQGLKYGHCAQDEVNKAVQLDPRAAVNYVSRGVGYYYLPTQFGGGNDLAIKDFQKGAGAGSAIRRCAYVAGAGAPKSESQCGGSQGVSARPGAESRPRVGEAAARKNAGPMTIRQKKCEMTRKFSSLTRRIQYQRRSRPYARPRVSTAAC